MSRVIALIGSLDTKGIECRFVQHRLHELGHETLLIDVGVLGRPAVTPDISSSEVAAAGGCKLDDLVSQQDRGQAVAAMSRGAERLVPRLFADGQFHAIMSLGGSSGTSVACAAMRALPLGVPKVMVSTVAGGDVSGYVGVSDIVMIPSIVDVSGINRISREVFSRGRRDQRNGPDSRSRRGRQAIDRRHHVREHDDLCGSGQKDTGGCRIRSIGISRHRLWRTHDGEPD